MKGRFWLRTDLYELESSHIFILKDTVCGFPYALPLFKKSGDF